MRFKSIELAKLVAASPAPKFYVSVEEAFIKYGMYKRGKIDVCRPQKIAMFNELFSRYEKEFELVGDKEFKYSIMLRCINSQAPSFYLEPCTAVDFYYRAMRKRRAENRRRL